MVGPELSGEIVNLRSLRADDLVRRADWLNDDETVRLFTGSIPVRRYLPLDAERWRQSLEADLTAMVWAIETKSLRHIGDVDLHAVDRFYKSGKLTILIGDKSQWSNGYGTDAIKVLLNYAFTQMRMLSIDLRVFDFNKRGIRCYEKCGFQRTSVPSPGQMGASEPGEVYMTVNRERFFADNPNAIFV